MRTHTFADEVPISSVPVAREALRWRLRKRSGILPASTRVLSASTDSFFVFSFGDAEQERLFWLLRGKPLNLDGTVSGETLRACMKWQTGVVFESLV